MFRQGVRHLGRTSIPRLPYSAHSRRLIGTASPVDRPRSWKSSAVRWGLAGTLLYYYNINTVFADEPEYAVHAPPETQHESETYPTLDQLAAQREARRQSASPQISASPAANADAVPAPATGSPEELEDEADQQGAFNEETGEINWDCPCLGGMAHGPCGEEFRSAFSCFVYSKEEPKGIDCIEKFKGMQECFRKYPEVYGAELEDDEAPPEAEAAQAATPAVGAAGEPSPGDAASPIAVEPSPAMGSGLPNAHQTKTSSGQGEKVAARSPDQPDAVAAKRARAQAATQQVQSQHDATSESDAMVPKAWHDTTDQK